MALGAGADIVDDVWLIERAGKRFAGHAYLGGGLGDLLAFAGGEQLERAAHLVTDAALVAGRDRFLGRRWRINNGLDPRGDQGRRVFAHAAMVRTARGRGNAPKRHVFRRPCTTLGRPLVRVRFAGSRVFGWARKTKLAARAARSHAQRKTPPLGGIYRAGSLGCVVASDATSLCRD